jgi:hypothetical protein
MLFAQYCGRFAPAAVQWPSSVIPNHGHTGRPLGHSAELRMDMFNNKLKAKLDAVCIELAVYVAETPSTQITGAGRMKLAIAERSGVELVAFETAVRGGAGGMVVGINALFSPFHAIGRRRGALQAEVGFRSSLGLDPSRTLGFADVIALG